MVEGEVVSLTWCFAWSPIGLGHHGFHYLLISHFTKLPQVNWQVSKAVITTKCTFLNSWEALQSMGEIMASPRIKPSLNEHVGLLESVFLWLCHKLSSIGPLPKSTDAKGSSKPPSGPLVTPFVPCVPAFTYFLNTSGTPLFMSGPNGHSNLNFSKTLLEAQIPSQLLVPWLETPCYTSQPCYTPAITLAQSHSLF